MKIAVYSGSFNPLHIGHLAILEYLVNETDFDMVYLVVSPVNPFKEGKKQTSAQERVRLAKEAVQRHSATLSGPNGDCKVKVEDIELSMPAPQYTRRTLDALQAREPENDFTLIIGGDNLAAFTRWRDYDYIIERYGLAVYPREGYDINASLKQLKNLKERIQIISAPEVTISSTDIREGLVNGDDMSKWLM